MNTKYIFVYVYTEAPGR